MGKDLFNDYFRFFGVVQRLLDLAILLMACLLSFWLYFHSIHLPDSYIRLLLMILFLSVPLFPYFGLYRIWRGGSVFEELKAYFLAVSALFLTMALLLFLLKIGSVYSRGWFILWFGLSVALAFAFRILLRSTVRHLRCKGFNQKNIVLVGGDNALGQRVFATLSQAHWLGFDIKGVFYQTDVLIPDAVNLGKIEQLAAYLAREKVDEVWITLPLRQIEQVQKVLNLLQNSTVNVRLVPDIFSLSLINHSMTEVAGLPVISLSSSPMTTGNRLLKAIEDKLLASLILLLIWPVMLVLAIGVKLSSKGTILFKQRRYGLSGRSVWVWKFRTMTVCEDGECIKQAVKNDVRITHFGAFLRRTSLDELPQFINVLQGQMSIVGPRPHAIVHNEQYRKQIPKYILRHIVKPGITGWAQINGCRGETDTLEKMEQRIAYDLYYIENWSLLFDLKIIALTVFKGFIHKNAY